MPQFKILNQQGCLDTLAEQYRLSHETQNDCFVTTAYIHCIEHV